MWTKWWAGKLTHYLHLSFTLLYHGNGCAITTAAGHHPVVQYVLGVASVIHLLHETISLFLPPKGKFKTDLLIHVNLVYLKMHLNESGKKLEHFKYLMEN